MASPFYSYAPALDPATGDWRAGRPAGRPATEAVLLMLRTQRGSVAADPDYGVDYALVPSATANVAATWQAEVRRALAALVRAGVIGAGFVVAVDAPRGAQLFVQVDFTDPRTGASDTVRRLVAA